MPKYRRKRFGNVPYTQAAFSAGLPMGISMMPYGMIPPPMGFIPTPFMPMKSSPQPYAVSNREAPEEPSSPPPEPLSKIERACLPYFRDELSRTQPRKPTDVMIIDFDRTLLGTPMMNHDLIDTESRHTLESKLGAGAGWWQSRPVLEAAIEAGQWNRELLSLARRASESEFVVLVITTARSTSDIGLIENALEAQGVSRVDHFACSTAAVSEDEEDEEEHKDANIALDGWAKQVMLELLLESYETLERIVVYDSIKGDREKYLKAANQFVRGGWLNAEAFYIADLLPRRVQLESLPAQRQLIQQVLAAANVPVEKSVVVNEWVHKLTTRSKESLGIVLAEAIGESLLDRFFLADIGISKGSLPPDMRTLTAQRGKHWKWTVRGYKVENRILWLKLETGNGSQQSLIKVAWLVRGIDDADTNLDELEDQESLSDSPNAATNNADAPSPPTLPVLKSLTGLSIETVVYERRELRIQKKRT